MICGDTRGVEVRAEPHHVEAELARDQLGAGPIDAAAHRVQPIAHRAERTLGPRRERRLGGRRLVIVERQRAVDPAQLPGEQRVQRVEGRLHAVAVATREVTPRDDGHRRVVGTVGG